MKFYRSEGEMVIESKIKPNLKMIYTLKIQGISDRHIAKALGISLGAFRRAVEEYEELKEICEDAMMLLCSNLRQVAIERALGTDGKRDGNGILIGPDANLAVRLLDKIDPLFREKKESSVEVVSVEEIIRRLNEKRREEMRMIEGIEEKHLGEE